MIVKYDEDFERVELREKSVHEEPYDSIPIDELVEIWQRSKQMPCEDAISREAAIKLIGDAHFKNYGEAIMLIQELPSVAPSRPSGEWKAKDGVFYCSCCGNDSAGLSEDDVYVYEVPLPNYCQDCGAQMKGANDERV